MILDHRPLQVLVLAPDGARALWVRLRDREKTDPCRDSALVLLRDQQERVVFFLQEERLRRVLMLLGQEYHRHCRSVHLLLGREQAPLHLVNRHLASPKSLP